jgi:hypothetical protein
MNAETKTKSVFESGLDELRTLRDEVRLKLHLAGKDVKDQWESTFEPRIEKLEHQVRTATDNTVDTLRDAIDQARDSFKGFRDRLTGNSNNNDDSRGSTSVA